MLGLNQPGADVWISDSNNPKRKLRHTLELMRVKETMVGINTNRANALAREAMEIGMIDHVDSNSTILPEQKYGENSRIDFLVRNESQADHYIEVKNVHLQRRQGLHEFPDSVTARGTKHLAELAREVRNGNRATMLFMIQREDGDTFAIAEDVDKQYGGAFRKALNEGVNVIAIKCRITEDSITPFKRVHVRT